MRCVSARAVVCSGLAFAFAALPICAATPLPDSPVPPVPLAVGGNPAPAVWKERHIHFFYRGRTARYSCEGLQDKVRAMLLDLGARRDMHIVAIGCEDYNRIQADPGDPRLDIIFSAPALPDAAAKPLEKGDLAAIDARFVAFIITSDAFRNMGIGDCELVEEFTRQILPKLVTRNVKQDISCVHYQQSGSRFLVKGDILKALPRGSQTAGQQQLTAP